MDLDFTVHLIIKDHIIREALTVGDEDVVVKTANERQEQAKDSATDGKRSLVKNGTSVMVGEQGTF